MTSDPARSVRELLDHCAAALERLGAAVRRGLPPPALRALNVCLAMHAQGLRRLAGEMAALALEGEAPALMGLPVAFTEPKESPVPDGYVLGPLEVTAEDFRRRAKGEPSREGKHGGP